MKINYGIYIGSTSASIARMEAGEPMVKKTDTYKDALPLCVYINKNGSIQVGDSAYNAYIRDKLSGFRNRDYSSNAFIEFTRTLGTDKKYYSSNIDKDFSSEELLAEVIKTLCSFVKDDVVNAAVITIPASFGNNQKEAIRQSAYLAGIEQVELIQEPIAATLTYGLDRESKEGFILVFNFGKGGFDASLLKVEDGIMRLSDTEGDIFLGEVNLDYAIVDHIIIPYLEENYTLKSIKAEDECYQNFRDSLLFYAKETRKKMQFNDTHCILSDFGDIPGEDDNGEEFELDITVTQADIKWALGPVFQKAIDICKHLLERNNLNGSSVDSLVLVGGTTYSPVVRKMLEQQICKPDTSVDSETVLVKGAALYASTIEKLSHLSNRTNDKTAVALEIGYEASSVELEEFVTLKILADKTEREISEKVFAEIIRMDQTWSSGRVEINDVGEVVEVHLLEGKTNTFNVALYDDKGRMLNCTPNQFTIKQGVRHFTATLAYNIGTEVKRKDTGKIVFQTIKVLKKIVQFLLWERIMGLKRTKH